MFSAPFFVNASFAHDAGSAGEIDAARTGAARTGATAMELLSGAVMDVVDANSSAPTPDAIGHKSTIPPIASIVISCIGTVGNLVTVSVLCSPVLRPLTTSVYLLVLLLLDTTILWVSTAFTVINTEFIDVKIRSDFLCGVLNVSPRCLELAANWIVVFVAVERFVVIWFPLQRRRFCVRRNAAIIISSVCLVAALSGLRLRGTFKSLGDSGHCAYTSKDLIFLTNVEPWIKTLSARILPIALVFVFNVLIIVGARKIPTKNSPTLRDNLSLGKASPALSLKSLFENDAIINTSKSALINRHSANATCHNRYMMVVLITISCFFLLCNLPLAIIELITMPQIQFLSIDQINLFWATLLISQVHHSTNFVLYTVSGQNFRREFKIVFLWLFCGGEKPAKKESAIYKFRFRSDMTHYRTNDPMGGGISQCQIEIDNL